MTTTATPATSARKSRAIKASDKIAQDLNTAIAEGDAQRAAQVSNPATEQLAGVTADPKTTPKRTPKAKSTPKRARRSPSPHRKPSISPGAARRPL
jgi:hypothetical protein